jgi:hypothetical protein
MGTANNPSFAPPAGKQKVILREAVHLTPQGSKASDLYPSSLS